MRPYTLSGIEKAGYGVHAVTASAPALDLTLFGRMAFDEQGAVRTECSPPTSLRESKTGSVPEIPTTAHRSFSTPNTVNYCQEYLLQYLHPQCYALYRLLLWT